MTAGERFALIISLLSLIFMVLAALLGFLIKITVKWTQTEDKIGELVGDVQELIIRKDKDHELIRQDLRDRQARADGEHAGIRERLTWLERRELDQRRKADR